MWYNKAYDELEEQLANGDISQAEFRQEVRSLREELESCRQEAAEEAYNNY